MKASKRKQNIVRWSRGAATPLDLRGHRCCPHNEYRTTALLYLFAVIIARVEVGLVLLCRVVLGMFRPHGTILFSRGKP